MLFTVGEAAKRLAVSRSTLYQLLASKQLTSVHIGAAARITEAELERFIAKLEAQEAADDDA